MWLCCRVVVDRVIIHHSNRSATTTEMEIIQIKNKWHVNNFDLIMFIFLFFSFSFLVAFRSHRVVECECECWAEHVEIHFHSIYYYDFIWFLLISSHSLARFLEHLAEGVGPSFFSRALNSFRASTRICDSFVYEYYTIIRFTSHFYRSRLSIGWLLPRDYFFS